MFKIIALSLNNRWKKHPQPKIQKLTNKTSNNNSKINRYNSKINRYNSKIYSLTCNSKILELVRIKIYIIME